MVAHTVAADQCFSSRCFIRRFVYVLFLVLWSLCQVNNTYSRHDLLRIGVCYEQNITAEFLHSHKIPVDIVRSPGSPCITIPAVRRRRHRERKQKRGCRAGALARLRWQPHRPPLPSLFLTNARSLANKMDELRLQVATCNIVKDSCMLLTTETWLHSFIPNPKLVGYTAQRHDRTRDSSKSRGGGLCVYVNNNWCTDTVTVDSHCSPDLEYVTVKCRPIYLPREFTVVMITAVYIPPDANANTWASQTTCLSF